MTQAVFSPGELVGRVVLGLVNASFQRNNYRNAFFIIQSRPQLYKGLSLNQMVSRIIDNNGRDDKKKLIFWQKAI
jgi:hypothetical protein